MEGIVKEEIGREVGISKIIERKEVAGVVLIVRMEKGKDRAEILERGWKIRRNWGGGSG